MKATCQDNKHYTKDNELLGTYRLVIGQEYDITYREEHVTIVGLTGWYPACLFNPIVQPVTKEDVSHTKGNHFKINKLKSDLD